MKLTLNQRLTEFRKQMSSVSNLNKNHTAGDMKFFIFDYDPKDEIRIRDEVAKAIKSNSEIIHFDLYEMMINVINDSGYFDTILNMEKEYDKSLLLREVFHPMLAFEDDTSKPIIEKFNSTAVDDGRHIILITGVGKSYPIIRSHTILNNLQSIFKMNPVVMMYPGRFSVRKGHLKLFDRLDDDNYYRAFPIIDRGEE